MRLVFHITEQLHFLYNRLFKDQQKVEINHSTTFLFLTVIVISSCTNSGSDDFTTFKTSSTFDFHAIEEFDGRLYATGGNVWLKSDLAVSEDGISWEVDSLTNKSIFDLYSNEGILYGVGNDGYIFFGSPELQLSRTKYWGLLRAFTSAGESFVAVGGKDFNKGWIYKINSELTVDTAHYFENEIQDIACKDSGNCVACGYGAIFISNDYGASWKRSEENGDYYNSIAISPNGDMMIVGYAGSLITSKDNGISWEKIRDGHSPLANNKPFRKIKFNNNQGVIVGDNGLVWFSKDAGITWEDNSINSNLDLFDLAFHENHIYFASEAGQIIRLDQ